MASTPKRPLRGILKSSKSSTPPKSDEEAQRIALAHANIIEDRKAHDELITDSVVRLTELPIDRSPPFSSSNPSSRDADEFRSLVRIFQPGEYDDLVAERNVCGLCGYVLCGRPRRHFDGKGDWKLLNAGRTDFAIARREELERWCSQECARRALYVKVQLQETAAWERVGMPEIEIELLDEEKNDAAQEQLEHDLAHLKLQGERKAKRDTEALALERGDVGGKARADSMDVEIQENTRTSTPAAPSIKTDGDVVEGYKTKFGTKSTEEGGEKLDPNWHGSLVIGR
jgi:RNA polymerase II-associated protein 2